MIERALIFVPHPDDEINIAAGVLELLSLKKILTTVAICTNGDFIEGEGNKRYKEAQKVKSILGYQNLIFLGYGDDYRGKHICDLQPNEIAESTSGMNETYSVGDMPEYCFQKYGVHHKYTRNNLKNDIKNVIRDVNAGLIICVDMDSHPDHRTLSLLFEEAMCEVLLIERNYRPIVLKSFAYLGVWNGAYDFFDRSIKPTLPCLRDGKYNESLCYPHIWDERIRVENPRDFLSFILFKNKLFKSLLANWTQRLDSLDCFPRIANPDVCYWWRNTNNIAIHANICATSGDTRYLNDFLLLNPQSVRGKRDELINNSLCWRSSELDRQPQITITFAESVKLCRIVIYQHFDSSIRKIKLSLKDDFLITFNKTKVIIDLKQIVLNSITLIIEEYDSPTVALDEIECYESIESFPWEELPFAQYKDIKQSRMPIIHSFVKFIYRVFLKFIDYTKQR